MDSPTLFRVFKVDGIPAHLDLFAVSESIISAGRSRQFLISASLRTKFDRLFKRFSPVSTYGPHGYRSGLSLFFMLLGHEDSVLLKYFYWNAQESLQRYTFGIELSSWRIRKTEFLKGCGIAIENKSLYETVAVVLQNADAFRPLFDALRIRFLRHKYF